MSQVSRGNGVVPKQELSSSLETGTCLAWLHTLAVNCSVLRFPWICPARVAKRWYGDLHMYVTAIISIDIWCFTTYPKTMLPLSFSKMYKLFFAKLPTTDTNLARTLCSTSGTTRWNTRNQDAQRCTKSCTKRHSKSIADFCRCCCTNDNVGYVVNVVLSFKMLWLKHAKVRIVRGGNLRFWVGFCRTLFHGSLNCARKQIRRRLPKRSRLEVGRMM